MIQVCAIPVNMPEERNDVRCRRLGMKLRAISFGPPIGDEALDGIAPCSTVDMRQREPSYRIRLVRLGLMTDIELLQHGYSLLGIVASFVLLGFVILPRGIHEAIGTLRIIVKLHEALSALPEQNFQFCVIRSPRRSARHRFWRYLSRILVGGQAQEVIWLDVDLSSYCKDLIHGDFLWSNSGTWNNH